MAHDAETTTVVVDASAGPVTATFDLPLAALDEALDAVDGLDADGVTEHLDALVAYVTEHLEVTGGDGEAWTETVTAAGAETIEGVEHLSVAIAFGTAGADVGTYTLSYDGIVEAVESHDVTVVTVDEAGEFAVAGVLTAASPLVTVTDGASGAGFVDMVRHGFSHVLEGADHLLFLLTLLLPAPLLAVGRRWRRGEGARGSLRKLVHVVTAFTLGHSLTLVASALGWVTVPSQPVELLIAVSVGVSAIHAIRPLARRGEAIIAVVFGLVHGLAFAGILDGLGLEGTASWTSLLGFDLGIEAAQLLTIAVTFPSLYLLSRTRVFPPVRLGGALLALAAATGWAVERLGLASNPLGGLEAAAIAHPWWLVAGLGLTAIGVWTVERRPGTLVAPGQPRAWPSRPARFAARSSPDA